ncbi:MAG: acylneuraminate cytidylyltransferase [Kiritimatiellae bacterium]|nr:acylneuraminate cytidylyltransferase [Kiritimatiellia bacterium]
MTEKCIAVIPARGGSKGIPRKNIKPLCGKPLIGWMMEAALESKSIGRVFVSTDDAEIAVVAESYGAEVVMRPVDIAGDFSKSEDAVLHLLDELEQAGEELSDVVVFLQCTSPLTTAKDIDATVDLVSKGGYDTAGTGVLFHSFLWKEGANGSYGGVNHDQTKRLMRQEREEEFLETGAVYAMRCDEFRRNKFRFFGKIGFSEVPASRSPEIDTLDDWLQVESLVRTIMPEKVSSVPIGDSIPLVSELDTSAIKAVVTDFDGVLTDNGVEVDADGHESVRCNRSDGWGISCLKSAGYHVACISTEKNPVVARRCEKMQIPYVHGSDDKEAVLREMCKEWGIELSNVLYVGNDLSDAACIEVAGIGVIPSDAIRAMESIADAKTLTRGGEGVLREISSALLGSSK